MFDRKFALVLFSFCLSFQVQALYACPEMADMGPMHECCCPETMAPAPDNELLSDHCCCEIELEVQVTSADLENDNYIKATSLSSAVLKIPISLFLEETVFFNPLPLIETEAIPFPTIHADQIATANSQLYLTTARLRL